MSVVQRMRETIEQRGLASAQMPILLMVSGGSDSTALAYAAHDLYMEGVLGPLAIFHFNHQLRGDAADADEEFVQQMAGMLAVPFECARANIGAIAVREHANVEAVARRERYAAAHAALARLCARCGVRTEEGRIFTAHTVDDRIENFYMRSIVGTGPGGFRSMRYLNGLVARPLLDCEREELRDWICERASVGMGKLYVCDPAGSLWREDATNAQKDRFRTFVRHEIVPLVRERNAQLSETLTRTMNLIADEDDLLEEMAADLEKRCVLREQSDGVAVLLPELGREPLPLRRRVCVRVLRFLLPEDSRPETAAVEAILAGFTADGMNSGYVANIQGNLAVSANKRGVRIEPMASFRSRRKMNQRGHTPLIH